jgi:hypothetical protein
VGRSEMHTRFGGENVGKKSFGCSRLRRGIKWKGILKELDDMAWI